MAGATPRAYRDHPRRQQHPSRPTNSAATLHSSEMVRPCGGKEGGSIVLKLMTGCRWPSLFILGDGTAGGASPREGGRCQRWPPPSRLRAPPFLGQGFPCACARKRIVDARIHECGGGRCYLKRLGFFCCLAGPALEHECICESMKRKRRKCREVVF